jgi:hypothetical protein
VLPRPPNPTAQSKYWARLADPPVRIKAAQRMSRRERLTTRLRFRHWWNRNPEAKADTASEARRGPIAATPCSSPTSGGHVPHQRGTASGLGAAQLAAGGRIRGAK